MCLGIPGCIVSIDDGADHLTTVGDQAARTLNILNELGEAQAELESMRLSEAHLEAAP